MKERQRKRFITATGMISAISGMVACLVSNVSSPAIAQQANIDAKPGFPAFAPGMIDHMQAMRRFKDSDRGAQQTPPVIPKFEMDNDAAGGIASFQPGGATFPANNAFFQDLGTNGRTCFTCHQPQNGWSVSAASVAARFADSKGTDPLFRLVDGATCPTADVSTLQAKRQAYALLINKGLIRIGLPMPSGAQFEVTSVDDPYSCNTKPVTGLTSPTAGIVSVYRRPLPSTNLGFLSTIMWDGREPDLTSQARDATLGHAQANAAPTDAQLAQIVAFESGVYTAQEIDRSVGVLHGDGALGGPVALSLQPFFIGVNDPLGTQPERLAIYIQHLRHLPAMAERTRKQCRAPPVDRPRRRGIQHDQDQHQRRCGPQRCAWRYQHSGILRHLPRHAQRRRPFRQGAARHWSG